MQDDSLKILVVDDDEIDRLSVCRALRKAGLDVDLAEACDYSTAIAALKTVDFDCAFIDYRLPDQDGLALVQSLRQAGIDIPLVILTGQSDDQIAVDLIKAGASDYLSKDRVSPRSLSRRLQNAIRIHQANVEAASANQRLQESEERFRFVLEGANDGIWDYDLITQEIYWNDRLLEIVGFQRSDIEETFDSFCQLIYPDDQPKFQAAIAAHLDRGASFDLELRFCHASGELRHGIIRAKAQRDSQQTPFRIAGVVIDITTQKQAEERLAIQNKLLTQTIAERDQIARQREDFVSRLTHDLRTPLVAAGRMFGLIQDGMFGTISTEMRQIVATMINNNHDLLQMVNNLLEVYRHEAGRKELTYSSFALQTLVHDVVQELRPLADEKGLALSLEVEPEIESDLVLNGDRLELRRVFTNLVSNAIKFTDAGSVQVEVSSKSPDETKSRSDSWISIAVHDTGAGISADDQVAIFERFRQTQGRRSGIGLGLYLSRRIVEAHHGIIRVQSEPRSGSTFTVYLPRAIA
jgi:PAS domain S-box-containing protein